MGKSYKNISLQYPQSFWQAVAQGLRCSKAISMLNSSLQVCFSFCICLITFQTHVTFGLHNTLQQRSPQMNCVLLCSQVCVLYFYAFFLKRIKPLNIRNNTFFLALQETLSLMWPTLLFKTLRNNSLTKLKAAGEEKLQIASPCYAALNANEKPRQI